VGGERVLIHPESMKEAERTLRYLAYGTQVVEALLGWHHIQLGSSEHVRPARLRWNRMCGTLAIVCDDCKCGEIFRFPQCVRTIGDLAITSQAVTERILGADRVPA
jgi:hypothetical protein